MFKLQIEIWGVPYDAEADCDTLIVHSEWLAEQLDVPWRWEHLYQGFSWMSPGGTTRWYWVNADTENGTVRVSVVNRKHSMRVKDFIDWIRCNIHGIEEVQWEILEKIY